MQQLVEYIHTQDPTLKGWSRRIIYKMAQFYDVYSSEQFIARTAALKLLPASTEFVPILAAQMDEGQIVPPQATQIQQLLKTTWTNHQIIMNSCSLLINKYSISSMQNTNI